MTDAEYFEALAGRSANWTAFLRQKRALPLLVLGLTLDDPPEITLIIPENISSDQVRDLLRRALALAAIGAVIESGPPAGGEGGVT